MPVTSEEFSLARWVARLVAVVLISISYPALAADADDLVSTNADKRPIEELFKTDTVYPQDKGELEVDLASFHQKNTEGSTWTIPLSIEYGLTDRWQVEAEWNAYVQNHPAGGSVARGIGDLELGTQYSFMNIGGSLFHIAPLFSVELPLGDVNKGLSDGFVEYEPAVVLARDFPQLHHTQLFTEAGVNFPQRVERPADADDAESAADEFNFGTGFFTLFPHGAASLEFNWTNSQWNRDGTENLLYLTPGVIWKPARGVEFGLGIPVGLNSQSDRYELIAHVVYEF
jgi:hypothetical protein